MPARSLLALEEPGEAGEEAGHLHEDADTAASPAPDTEAEQVGDNDNDNDNDTVQAGDEVLVSAAPSNHCIQPAVTQFPHPLLDKHARQQGGLLLHIAVAFYMFIGQ